VEFEVHKRVTAPTDAFLEQGRQETNFIIEKRADAVIACISAPNAQRNRNNE
jgi:hypothetical protein